MELPVCGDLSQEYFSHPEISIDAPPTLDRGVQSVNMFQESATALIDPSGNCQAYLPYGQEGVLIQAIRPEDATGFLAARYAPQRYQEFKTDV